MIKNKMKKKKGISSETSKSKYLVICSDGKKYCGTPEQIVSEMSSWDVMCGRVKNNDEYMELVGERSSSTITTNTEIDFLRFLEEVGNITLTESN